MKQKCKVMRTMNTSMKIESVLTKVIKYVSIKNNLKLFSVYNRIIVNILLFSVFAIIGFLPMMSCHVTHTSSFLNSDPPVDFSKEPSTPSLLDKFSFLTTSFETSTTATTLPPKTTKTDMIGDNQQISGWECKCYNSTNGSEVCK